MEMPAQKFERVLSALEDLAVQEAASFQVDDFGAMIEAQERAESLVAYVSGFDTRLVRSDFLPRLVAVREKRAGTSRQLAEKILHTRAQLREVQANQRRITHVAPAYASSESASERRLLAVG